MKSMPRRRSSRSYNLRTCLLAAILLVAAMLPGGFSCASSGPSPSADETDRVHLITHERGTCRLCEFYHAAADYVVRIRSGDSVAAGVVVTSDGIVATNAHVVRGVDQVTIERQGGRRFTGQVVARDPSEDLALLRVGPTDLSWSSAAVETGPLPQVGIEVYVIGHPLGFGWTLSRGIVSAHRRIRGLPMIQTDAAISPGNSGGPLLDKEGHLVGIVTSVAIGGGAENLAFARPVSALIEFMRREDVLPEAVGDSRRSR